MNRKQQLEQKGILVLRDSDEEKEIEFELNFLSSLSLPQRFLMMQNKTQELKNNLEKNGHKRIDIFFLSLDDMIKMKKAAGRNIDVEDLKYLKEIKKRKAAN